VALISITSALGQTSVDTVRPAVRGYTTAFSRTPSTHCICPWRDGQAVSSSSFFYHSCLTWLGLLLKFFYIKRSWPRSNLLAQLM